MNASSTWNVVGENPVESPSPASPPRRRAGHLADVPISQEVLTWLLFWPLLTLVAGHAVYFAGPAPTAEAYQNGAAMAGARGSHLHLYVYMLFLLGFVLAGHRRVWATVKNNLVVLAMLIVAACSAFWSVAPVITLQMTIQVGLCTLFACYISSRYTIERLMQLFVFMGVASALLSILFVIALPAYGVFQGYAGGAWQGITNQKNTLGLSMAFLLTPIFFMNSHSRNRRILYGALLLFLIYKSQSRGAWADTAGMLAFVAWLTLARRLRSNEFAIVLLTSILAITVTVVSVVCFWPMIATAMGKDPTMTGRTGIYIEVWRTIVKHPVLGYGFGAFWSADSPEAHRIALAIGWPNIGYSESGTLEIALQIGFVGVSLIFYMIARAVKQGMGLLRSPYYSARVGWLLTVLFLALLNNLAAGWLMTADTLEWALILIACIGMNGEARRIAGSGQLIPTAIAPL